MKTIETILNVLAALMLVITFGAIYARQIMMPRINDARDRMPMDDTSAENHFKRLHRWLDVISALQLLAALNVLLRITVLGAGCAPRRLQGSPEPSFEITNLDRLDISFNAFA